jgi:hypothetical protein
VPPYLLAVEEEAWENSWNSLPSNPALVFSIPDLETRSELISEGAAINAN